MANLQVTVLCCYSCSRVLNKEEKVVALVILDLNYHQSRGKGGKGVLERNYGQFGASLEIFYNKYIINDRSIGAMTKDLLLNLEHIPGNVILFLQLYPCFFKRG